LLNVWRHNTCQLLLQIHDAILIQFPEEKESETIDKVTKTLPVEIELERGRKLVIPCDCKTGWNWAPFSEENPDGLMKYVGEDKRKRQQKKPTNILDRIR
jgi:hypothetical protein